MKINRAALRAQKSGERLSPTAAVSLASIRAVLFLSMLFLIVACGKKHEAPPADGAQTANRADAAREGEEIVERSRALDTASDSVMTTRAKIQEADAATREVTMTMYRKREPDGRRLMLIAFTSPAEDRDRSALITISKQGDIEATRYAQSNNSFIVATGAMSEDSLFGMSLQEMADGQPEKYDFRLAGEEMVGSSPVYRVEGKLKQGAESKFPRLAMLISKENSMMLGAEFYDSQDEIARRVTVERVEQISGYWTRMRWMVDNRARQKKIDFQTTEAKYDQKLPDSLFTRERLKKFSLK